MFTKIEYEILACALLKYRQSCDRFRSHDDVGLREYFRTRCADINSLLGRLAKECKDASESS